MIFAPLLSVSATSVKRQGFAPSTICIATDISVSQFAFSKYYYRIYIKCSDAVAV